VNGSAKAQPELLFDAAGYKAVGTLVYGWPGAYRKARAADRILRERLDRLGLRFDAIHSEFVGANACHGDLVGEPSPDPAEATKELAPLALNGPPVVTGLGAGRPKVEEIVAYWPPLIPRSIVTPQVSVVEA